MKNLDLVPVGNIVFTDNCKRWLSENRKNRLLLNRCVGRYIRRDFNTADEFLLGSNYAAMNDSEPRTLSVRATYETDDEKCRLFFKTRFNEDTPVTIIDIILEKSKPECNVIRHGKIIHFDFCTHKLIYN